MPIFRGLLSSTLVAATAIGATTTVVAGATPPGADPDAFARYSNCLKSTDYFFETKVPKESGLVNTIDDSEDVYKMEVDDKTGDVAIDGYEKKKLRSLQSKCGKNGGYFASVGVDDAENFKCALFGKTGNVVNVKMENFGHCLADIAECKEAAVLELIVQKELAENDMACYDAGLPPPENFETIVHEIDQWFGNKDDGKGKGVAGEVTEAGDPFARYTSCLESTAAFFKKVPKKTGLVNTLDDDSDVYKMDVDDKTGEVTIDGYEKKALKDYESKCIDNGGYFASVGVDDAENFKCALFGDPTVTVPLKMENFGHCLANVRECQEDAVLELIVQKELAENDMACFDADLPAPENFGEIVKAIDEKFGKGADEIVELDEDYARYSVCLQKTERMFNSAPEINGLVNIFSPDEEAKRAASEGDPYELKKDDKKGLVYMDGYSDAKIKDLQSDCVNTGGYFADIGYMGAEHFRCASFEDVATPVEVKIANFGQCLADAEECRDDNALYMILQREMAKKGMACYIGDGEAPDNYEDLSNELFEMYGVGESLLMSLHTGGLRWTEEAVDAAELNKDDKKCLQDTRVMIEGNEELKKAFEEYESSGEFDTNKWGPNAKGAMGGELGFSHSKQATNAYKKACKEHGGGYFFVKKIAEFQCREQTALDGTTAAKTHMKLTNVGNCLAHTPECQVIDTVPLEEKMWEQIGLDCVDPSLPSWKGPTASGGGVMSSINDSVASMSESIENSIKMHWIIWVSVLGVFIVGVLGAWIFYYFKNKDELKVSDFNTKDYTDEDLNSDIAKLEQSATSLSMTM